MCKKYLAYIIRIAYAFQTVKKYKKNCMKGVIAIRVRVNVEPHL